MVLARPSPSNKRDRNRLGRLNATFLRLPWRFRIQGDLRVFPRALRMPGPGGTGNLSLFVVFGLGRGCRGERNEEGRRVL